MTVPASFTDRVRVGCVQWLMREFDSRESLLQRVEQQVAAMADYRCDFVMYPEFFTAPLLTLEPSLDSRRAMRALAGHSAAIRDALSAMAVRYRVNLIAGSMPVLEGRRLFNVSYLCHRSGKIDHFAKLHPTPGERRDWDMRGGEGLQAFDTDCGRVGLLICYDVEFPEAPRLLARQGVDLLFVPFWTDSRQGYQRVRFCAQARAIENECYVVLAGSVGCLPQASCLDAQYAQSAVFSPSDFGFPHDAIVIEAAANCETTLVCDLEPARLHALRRQGSVRNGEDRRDDLYELRWRGGSAPPRKAAKSRKNTGRRRAPFG